jgi:DNA-binding NarL/FixJ family response regulator
MIKKEKFQGKSVLIIEEDNSTRDKARNFLFQLRASKVQDAPDFKKGYAATQSEIFDFIVCDFRIFNTDSQAFIKKLKLEKKLFSDDQLIMSSDFFESMENANKKEVKALVKKKSAQDILDQDVKRNVYEILKPYCQIKAFMLTKSDNQMVEATVLNIDVDELMITLSTRSLEKIDNYARQIKFESVINETKKDYTIIGDLRLIDDSDQFFREFELSVPEQYIEMLKEIEDDLFTVQRKTRDLLGVMKGDLV